MDGSEESQLETEIFDGVIKKFTDGSGVVNFHFFDKEERAIFFKENVYINDRRLSQQDSLLSVLSISMPVSIKVTPCKKHSFNFEALHVQISVENQSSSPVSCSEEGNKCCDLVQPSSPVDCSDEGDEVQISTESSGMETLSSASSDENVLISRDDEIKENADMTSSNSLLTLLEDATLWRSPSLEGYGNRLNGIIESFCEIGGSILFKDNNEIRKAIFCIQNVYIGKTRLKPEIFLLPPLKTGMPVSFIIAECKGPDDRTVEAAAVFIPKFENKDICHGTIICLSEKSGEVTFQINQTVKSAIFFKHCVRVCDLNLKPGVSLFTVLKINMKVSLVLEERKESKDCDYKVTVINVDYIPACFTQNLLEENSQLYQGIVCKLKDTCGLIEFTINGEKQNAIFFSNIVRVNKKSIGDDVSLLSVLMCDMMVSLKVKICSHLSNCNFVATDVEVQQIGSYKSCTLYGNIIVLEKTSGVVAFWNYNTNKQEKAIFYKRNFHINGKRIKGDKSLSSELRIGMYVSLKVQKCSINDFKFKALRIEVSEEISGIHNIIKVSASKHISCGLGTIVEIISATSAQLQFELDGQHHVGLFTLSDIYVDGKRCDDFESLLTLIMKDDMYFFDATKRTDDGHDDYLITCVWQGKKPMLSTLLEPYKALIHSTDNLPCSVVGKVISLFPSQIAIVQTNVCNPVLIILDSLRYEKENHQITEESWIQDCLRVGDKLLLQLCVESKFDGFPLAKVAKKISCDSSVKNNLVPEEGLNPSPDAVIHSMISISSSGEDKELENSSYYNDGNITKINTPRHVNEDQILHGIITCLEPQSGSIEVVLEDKKQMLVFTKKEMHLDDDDDELINRLPLSSVLEIGLPVSVTVMFDSLSENPSFKITHVDASLNIDSRTFYGSVEKFNDDSGIILFYLNDRAERAIFMTENVFYNGSAVQPPPHFQLALFEVHMRVSFRIRHCTNVEYFNYEAVVVQIDDRHMEVYGLTVSLNNIEDRVFNGYINSVMEEYGTIKFKLDDNNYKAIYLKKDVLLKNSDVPLQKGLKHEMLVDFKLRKFNDIFQAVQVSVGSALSSPQSSQLRLDDENGNSFVSEKAEADFKVQLHKGLIKGYLSTSIGIVECFIHGKRFEALFNRDMIVHDNHLGVNLMQCFPLGEKVLFDGKLQHILGKLKLKIISVYLQEYKKSKIVHNVNALDIDSPALRICPTSSNTKTTSYVEESLRSSPYTTNHMESMKLEGQIVSYLSPSIGIIKCCVNEKENEVLFSKDIVCDNDVDKSLEKPFSLGEKVKFDCKFELFLGQPNLRVLSVWQNQASQNLRRELRKYDNSLCPGEEYSGIVFEVLNDASFTVFIKNVPVLVNKEYFHEPSKFASSLSSVKLGEIVSLVIDKLHGDWIAVEAWRTNENFNGSDVLETVKSCSEDGVHEGELKIVASDCGFLIDVDNEVIFQPADVLLFGVPMMNMDLALIFKPGDKFNYTICLETQNPSVWYGTRYFSSIIHQRHEILNFCSARSVDETLCNELVKRVESQLDTRHLDTNRSHEIYSNDILDVQKTTNCYPDHHRRKNTKPALDQEKLKIAFKNLMPTFGDHSSDSNEIVDEHDSLHQSFTVNKNLKKVSFKYESQKETNFESVLCQVVSRALNENIDQQFLNSEDNSTVSQQIFNHRGKPASNCESLGLERSPQISEDQLITEIHENVHLASDRQSLRSEVINAQHLDTSRYPKTYNKEILDVHTTLNCHPDQTKSALDQKFMKFRENLLPTLDDHPCDSTEITKIINEHDFQHKFSAVNEDVKKLSMKYESETETIFKSVLDREISYLSSNSDRIIGQQILLNSEDLKVSQQISNELRKSDSNCESLGLNRGLHKSEDHFIPQIHKSGQALKSEVRNKFQQLLSALSDKENQITLLREQLDHATCPIITESVKQIFRENVIDSKNSCSELNHDEIDQTFARIESGIKECISGHILRETIQHFLDETIPLKSDPNESVSSSECVQKTVRKVSSSLEDPAIEIAEELVDPNLMVQVIHVDKGTQTMATGPVFFTSVFSD